jgi:preprotein translocase subunit SecA
MKVSSLQKMSRKEIVKALQDAAETRIESTDLADLDPFLVEDYPQHELASWVQSKFDVESSSEEFQEFATPDLAADYLREKARTLYRTREINYPIEFRLEMTSSLMQKDPDEALKQFINWVQHRYELDWSSGKMPSNNPIVLRDILQKEAASWDEDRIRERAQRGLSSSGSIEAFETWSKENVGVGVPQHYRENWDDDPLGKAMFLISDVMRLEVLQLERWILLQIVDNAWKEHLHSMDQLREAIGYRSFSQLDPRIEFKREGATLFEDMRMETRDRVTDLIFKARLQAQVANPTPQETLPSQPTSTPQEAPAKDSQPATPRPAPATTTTQRQPAAGTTDSTHRQNDRQQSSQKKRQPVAAGGTVGRNEPCPCGSGKKFKKCCGAR